MNLLELRLYLCSHNVSGTYTYETLAQQVESGQINVQYIDDTVRFLLRTKFSLGLFESTRFWSIHCFLADIFPDPYPYVDYSTLLRTSASQAVLQRADRETIILLENKNSVLPLSKTIGSIALIGPQVNRVSVSYKRFYRLELLKSILIVWRLCLL